MNEDIGLLYQFVLLEMVADSYLEDIATLSDAQIKASLTQGNNRRPPDPVTGGVTRFAAAQAEELLGRYQIVHQLSDNPGNGRPTTFNGIPLNTGFSATLIQERGTNNFTLAIRSTESKPWSQGGDMERDAFGADVAIAKDGFAWAQVDSMEQYYAWLKSSKTLPPGATLNVTGYSLGGHLAAVFTELHRNDADVTFGQTVTFNAPGRGTWNQSAGSLADMLALYRAVLANPDVVIPSPASSEFAGYLGAKLASGPIDGLSIYRDRRYVWAQAATTRMFGTSGLYLFPPDPLRKGLTNGADAVITQVYGREFPNDRSGVANSGVHGPARSVFVEAQPVFAGVPSELWGTGDFGGGHSIVLLADSLALMRAMNRLDGTQTIDSLGAIFVRASSRTPDSKVAGNGSDSRAESDVLENSLDALRRALLGSNLSATPYATGARGFGDIYARDGWYENLNAATNSETFASLAGKVTILPISSDTATPLATTAKSDFGDLVALQTLSPFALEAGAGDAAAAALTAAWQSAHGDDYDAWRADAALTPQQREVGAAAFSDSWYVDRAAMLRWLLKANEQNIDYAAKNGWLASQSPAQPLQFQDLQSQIAFTVSQQALLENAPPASRVIFGRNDAPDSIAGADAADRLYGGGGADTLDGQGGNDYLEGNGGNDDLRGAAGNDVLVGGNGDDTLRGGAGDDRLLGGLGQDVYVVDSGEGIETIADADGLGQLVWDGEPLSGGLRIGDRVWRSTDERFTYTLSNDGTRYALHIRKSGSSGAVEIENFSRTNADLSILLSDTPRTTVPPTTARDILGDRALFDSDPATPGVQWITDDLGNLVTTSTPSPGIADFMVDSSGNDLIRTGGAADFIRAWRGGSDDIDAGAGNDGVTGGDGNDLIAGGSGADELAGGNGSDTILGGADDDVILSEHEIAYDSSTYDLVVPPSATVIRRWTYDDRFAASGFGIQVVQYSIEGITFESPWVGIGGWIERHDGSARDFVDAGDGSDLVYGGYGSDVILGGNGSDRLEGSGGDDVIDGGTGNDLISGDAPAAGWVSAVPASQHGNDLLFGAAGNDLLLGGGGSDMLDGGDGDDVLYGDMAAMVLAMPVGTPLLEQTPVLVHGADILHGGAGNDRIDGEGGDDLLIGGTGDDVLTGGTGFDVYEFDRGDGADSIFGRSAIDNEDELHFGAAVSSATASMRQVGMDLRIDTGAAGDSVTLKNWFAPSQEQQIAAVRFADGTTWSRDQINVQFVVSQSGTSQDDIINGFLGRDDIKGLEGNDTIRSGSGADLIEGGKGNDVLDGGIDSDRYVFRAGDGADVITSADQFADDALQFVGLHREDVALARTGNALVIARNNGTDRVTIDRYFESSSSADSRTVSGVQIIEFEGGVRLSVTDIRAMFQKQVGGSAGADYLVGGAADEAINGGIGDDRIYAYGGNDTLIGGDGNDYLDGGQGADVFEGGPGDDALSSPAILDPSQPSYLPPAYLSNGDDTYMFARGSGRDVVAEDDPSAFMSSDRVVLKDLLPGQVAFGRGDSGSLVGASEGDRDLLIVVRGSMDTLRVAGFFDDRPRFWVEAIQFGDGTVWNREQVIANLSPEGTASAGADFLLGSPQSDAIDGAGGNDVLWLGEGNDIGRGGDGDDHLQGGAGSDFLDGGAGNDRLFGGLGADVLDGGPGDDQLYGGNNLFNTDDAPDTYVFRAGGGRDTVVYTVEASGATDSILLGGLAPSNVELGWTTSNDLRIRVLGSQDVLLVERQFQGGAAKIGTILFDEGTTYDAATIEALARQNKDELITGSSGADVLDGAGGNDDLRGGAGNDTLLGGPGDDRLDGETGADVMDGGPGDDYFIVDNAGDVVREASGGGLDRVAAYASFVLPENVESLSLISGSINGTGNSLDNVLTGSSAANRLEGRAGSDVLDGMAGADTMLGGPGDDTYLVDNGSDSVTENANEGIDLIVSTVTRTLGANQEHLTLSGTAAINGTGNASENYLRGNGANNTLNGSGGADVLQGGGGNDTLTDTSGRGIHDGGDGTDTLTGGTDRQFFAGGSGSDALTLGGGADLIAFNRGHGADVVNAPTSGAGGGEKNDVISLAGVAYGELRLARESNDLVLKIAGTTDSIRLKNWYAASSNQTVNTLQMVVDSTGDYRAGGTDALRNKRIVQLNFGSIVAAFNAAGAPPDWSIPQATLTVAHVSGSDVAALGGQLAYRYGRDGNLAGVDFTTAVAVLADPNFATAAQSIGSGPVNGGVRLLSGSSGELGDSSVATAPAPDARTIGVGDVAAVPAQLELAAPGPAKGSSIGDRRPSAEGDVPPKLDRIGIEAGNWVVARPVERYVTEGDQEATAGGVGVPYLTALGVETALQGIDLGRTEEGSGVDARGIDATATASQWMRVDEGMRHAAKPGSVPLLANEANEFARSWSSFALLATAGDPIRRCDSRVRMPSALW